MLNRSKFGTLSVSLLFAVTFLATIPATARGAAPILLQGDGLRIVFSNEEPGALKIALEAFKKDFVNVMGTAPIVVNEMDADTSRPEIVIINRASGGIAAPEDKARELDGFESHRVYADAFPKSFSACHPCITGLHGSRSGRT
jgi:hypothetical protein